MILHQEHLNRLLPQSRQAEEITRITNSPDGTLLYTPFSIEDRKIDVIETLLQMCEASYHTTIGGQRMNFYKGASEAAAV